MFFMVLDDVFLSSTVASMGEPAMRVSDASSETYFLVMRRFFGLINGALRNESVAPVTESSESTLMADGLFFARSSKPFFISFPRAVLSPS